MADTKKPEAKLLTTLAPAPETERGKGIHIYAHPKNDRFIYCNGRSVIIRSFADPSQCEVFAEHKAKVNVAVFSPNGNWVASGDSDGWVFVWELSNKKIKNRVQCCRSILDINWSPENNKIVAVGDGTESRARVFTWDSGNNLGEILGHSKPILAVSYKPTRPFRIATASEDLGVGFYEGPPFKLKQRVEVHSRYPNCVRFSPDGERFITVGADSKINVFDGKTGERTGSLEAKDKKDNHSGSIYSFSWSPDSKQILTSSADKTAKIWNVEDGSVVKTFTFGKNMLDMQVATLWAGEHLLTVSLSGAINFLDLDNPDKPKRILHGHMSNISSLALAAGAPSFFTADNSGFVSTWDFKAGSAQWFEGKGHEKNIPHLALNATGETLATVAFDDRLRLNKPGAFNAEDVALGGQPSAVASANKDSELVAVGLTQQKLVLLRAGKVVSTLDLSFVPTCATFARDDTHLVLGGKDNHTHYFSLDKDVATEVKENNRKHGGALVWLSYSPDGQFLTAIDKSRTISFWDSKGENLNDNGWRFHSATVTDGAWSPSGKRLATGSVDESIMIWSDFSSFRPTYIKIEAAHSQGVTRLAFYDDNTLVSVGDDRMIRVWELPALA